MHAVAESPGAPRLWHAWRRWADYSRRRWLCHRNLATRRLPYDAGGQQRRRALAATLLVHTQPLGCRSAVASAKKLIPAALLTAHPRRFRTRPAAAGRLRPVPWFTVRREAIVGGRGRGGALALFPHGRVRLRIHMNSQHMIGYGHASWTVPKRAPNPTTWNPGVKISYNVCEEEGKVATTVRRRMWTASTSPRGTPLLATPRQAWPHRRMTSR